MLYTYEKAVRHHWKVPFAGRGPPPGRRECGPEQFPPPLCAWGRRLFAEVSMSKRNPLSHAVSVALSVNRTIFLRLHGAEGEVIAHAPLRAIEAAKVASELLSRIDDARKDIVIEGKPLHH